jgi:hypothetical protein
MRRIGAIAWLTFSEGVRMRIVLVSLVVLAFLVLRMPFALRGDETLTGRLQNFLAYSLGAISLLLSVATIFFSCATLTNEIKERSIHLVVTKPVSRFQILLGKWLGVNLLNLLIVVLCGVTVYGFACFIRSRPEQFARDRLQVRDVVWTARIASRPVVPEKEIAEAAARQIHEQARLGEIDPNNQSGLLVERITELMNRWRNLAPGEIREFRFQNLAPPETGDTVIQVRYKARGTPLPGDELVPIGWLFFDPDSGTPLHSPVLTRERSGDTHQFLVQATPVIRNGVAVLQVANPTPPEVGTGVFFDGDDSLQLLYKAASFESNYVKALLIIVLRLALLSAIGIFFGVFVSFPVACLCTCAFYLICIAMPFVLEAIGANLTIVSPKYDPYGVLGPGLRAFLVPFMRFAFPDFNQYDGVNSLVDGTYIPFSLMAWCLARTLLYGGVLLLLPGWLIFSRREIAEVIV